MKLSFQCKSELFELQLGSVFLFGHGCKVSTEEPPVLQAFLSTGMDAVTSAIDLKGINPNLQGFIFAA